MDTNTTKQELLAAVNQLIVSPDAHRFLEVLDGVWHLAAIYPIRLVGDAEPMNALVRLRIDDPGAYERVLDLVEQRRNQMGYDVLRKPKEDGYDKRDYMRDYMAQKRDRQKRAVEIENIVRGERDKLVGNPRLEFMRRQSERWKEQRDAFLERTKQQLRVSSLNKEQIQAALTQFWSTIDEELELRHKAAKAEQLKPSGHRRQPEVQLDVLLTALKFDPYKK